MNNKRLILALFCLSESAIADDTFFDRYQGKKQKLKQLMKDWETIHFELDEIS